jgi:hypothetical protein
MRVVPADVPIFSGASPRTVRAYHLGLTPETIVVSSEGMVLADWRGTYEGETKGEIERFFRVRLPETDLLTGTSPE